MTVKNNRFPKDIKKLKNFINEEYRLVFDDEKIQDLWRNYSSYSAAEWLSLPKDINSLKNDRCFIEVLKKILPNYLFLLFESNNCIPLYKKSIKINYLNIINENLKEKLLNLVPEFEKNYYSTILNKWNYKDFFIRINKNNNNYILYVIKETKNNMENSKNIEEFFNILKF